MATVFTCPACEDTGYVATAWSDCGDPENGPDVEVTDGYICACPKGEELAAENDAWTEGARAAGLVDDDDWLDFLIERAARPEHPEGGGVVIGAKIAAGIGLCAALVWGAHAAVVPDPVADPVDARCTARIERAWPENRDRIANKVGCDQAYRGTDLIGWKRGESRCDRVAYGPTFAEDGPGWASPAWMAAHGCVLIADDGSWVEEER